MYIFIDSIVGPNCVYMSPNKQNSFLVSVDGAKLLAKALAKAIRSSLRAETRDKSRFFSASASSGDELVQL